MSLAFWDWLARFSRERRQTICTAADRASGNHFYAWSVITKRAELRGREFSILP